MRRSSGLVLVGLCVALAQGCDDKPKNVAPAASSLEPAKPMSAGAVAFAVEGASSKASWTMDAPFEKIHGEIAGGLSGDLFIDAGDLTKSAGLLRCDLAGFVLFQQKRDDAKAEYGERVKNDTQNGHARTWLEISPDTPEEQRKKNAISEFKITKLTTDTPDLGKVSGATRTVTGVLTGDLLLHGRKLERTVKFEAVFTYDGDRPKSVKVRTTEPLQVGLDEFDVRPRDAFGHLAQKTLGDLAGKVAKAAPVTLEFSATAK